MGQTLTHGIYLPDEGERNCYNGLAGNWTILDGAVGTVAEHTTQIAGKAPAVHTHTKSDITDFPAYGNTAGTICEGNDSRLSDARTPVAHTHGKADVTDLFNSANTWSGDNTFSKAVGFTKVNATTLYARNARVELGDSGLSGDSYNQISFCDKNSDNLSYLRQTYTTNGTNALNIFVRNKFLNGVPNTAGTVDYAYFGLTLNADKSKEGILKASFKPYNNNTYDIGSSSYQWNNLYAKNYYYNGVAWGLDKANTWSDTQTFLTNPTIKNTGLEKGVSPTANSEKTVVFTDKNDNQISSLYARVNTNGESYVALRAENLYKNGAMDSTGNLVYSVVFIGMDSQGNPYCAPRADLYPDNTNRFNLGTSTNKWKSLNGINPGALGLPSGNYDPIDTKNWDLTGATGQSYTPTVNGWLFISIQNIAGNYLSIVSGRGAVSIDGTGAQGGLRAMLPVIANESVGITVKTNAIFSARFYPMQGNVS